jgi:hypothetical protein
MICLLVAKVSGWSRDPAPPARTIPLRFMQEIYVNKLFLQIN